MTFAEAKRRNARVFFTAEAKGDRGNSLAWPLTPNPQTLPSAARPSRPQRPPAQPSHLSQTRPPPASQPVASSSRVTLDADAPDSLRRSSRPIRPPQRDLLPLTASPSLPPPPPRPYPPGIIHTLSSPAAASQGQRPQHPRPREESDDLPNVSSANFSPLSGPSQPYTIRSPPSRTTATARSPSLSPRLEAARANLHLSHQRALGTGVGMRHVQSLRTTSTAEEAIAALTAAANHLAQLRHDPSPQDQAAIRVALRLVTTLVARFNNPRSLSPPITAGDVIEPMEIDQVQHTLEDLHTTAVGSYNSDRDVFMGMSADENDGTPSPEAMSIVGSFPNPSVLHLPPPRSPPAPPSSRPPLSSPK